MSDFKFSNETYFELDGSFKEGFTVVPNYILNNKNLSYKAVGIYVQILQYQNSPTHKIYMKSLMTYKTDGESSVSSGINELISEGFLTREAIRNERGQMKGYRYTVHAQPIEKTAIEPKSENPVPDNPVPENIARKKKIGFKENKKKENIEVEEGNEILNLYYDEYQLSKKKLPHIKKLIDKYKDAIELDLWHEIFISASEDSVNSKYKYVKAVIEDLVKDNIYTLNEYRKRADHRRSTNKPNNSISQKPKKDTKKSSQYMCDTKAEINGELKSFNDMDEDDINVKIDIKNGTNYTGKNPNFRKRVQQACDIG